MHAIFDYVLLVALYVLPALIAWRRHHDNASAILAFNILTGWTGLGWLVALYLSLATPAHISHNSLDIV